jgi:hypothetical protein
MTLAAVPFDFWNALIAGFGPTNAMSRSPLKSACTASGPALNVLTSSVTFVPRSFL